MIATILLVLALVAALLACFGVSVDHFNFGWLAIALWVASVLLGGAHVLTNIP